MTQNQIAYAGLVETQRHNQAEEEIGNKANELNAKRIEYENQYRTESNKIQDKYNTLSLQLQEAQGTRKLDLQQQLNELEMQKFSLDSDYKSHMWLVQEEQVRINGQTQREVERYQKKLNELGFAKNEIDAQLASIKAKQLEYEKYYNDNQVRIQDFNAAVNKMKVDNEYSLGLIRAENEQVRNELQAEIQTFQEAQMVTHSIWEGVSSILGFRRNFK